MKAVFIGGELTRNTSYPSAFSIGDVVDVVPITEFNSPYPANQYDYKHESYYAYFRKEWLDFKSFNFISLYEKLSS